MPLTFAQQILAAARALEPLNWREVTFTTADGGKSVTIPCNVSGPETRRDFDEGEMRERVLTIRHIDTDALETGLERPLQSLDFMQVGDGQTFTIFDTQRGHATTTATGRALEAVTRHATTQSAR
jgi:hypothetical protein